MRLRFIGSSNMAEQCPEQVMRGSIAGVEINRRQNLRNSAIYFSIGKMNVSQGQMRLGLVRVQFNRSETAPNKMPVTARRG